MATTINVCLWREICEALDDALPLFLRYPRKAGLRGSWGWWHESGGLPCYLASAIFIALSFVWEFKFTAVWRLWDSTSRKVELPSH